MFANVKKKISNFGKKRKLDKSVKKEDKQFYFDHIEEFRFFVKYYPVFKSVAIAVGKEEIVKLNKEKPCEFRKESDVPFRSKCEISVDGSDIKTLKECRECKVGREE